MFKKILVPTDGSPLSDKAINAAVEFAKAYGGSLVGICVSEPYPLSPLSEMNFSDERDAYEERSRQVAGKNVEKIVAAASAAGVKCETLVAESFAPHEEIIKAANRLNCDVIFMASHGRKGLSKLFLGSETQKVLVNSAIPVLVFR
ncbi:MAG TPA: universal stress protein [Noviherbaspirillum sp.]|uniref:universal stress protein n=1 Tax=Noviherbaspirillum sp. TaxID=1926288 RepID=UPI002B488988|nr:universal stress protein [Noviherbaspirillum sp.]HJV85134.1 universal stress protein [Noviherbaspirillum sp.]